MDVNDRTKVPYARTRHRDPPACKRMTLPLYVRLHEGARVGMEQSQTRRRGTVVQGHVPKTGSSCSHREQVHPTLAARVAVNCECPSPRLMTTRAIQHHVTEGSWLPHWQIIATRHTAKQSLYICRTDLHQREPPSRS